MNSLFDVKKESIETYETSIFRVGGKFRVTKIDGWFLHVSHFSAIILQSINRPIEELAVVGSSIIDEPVTYATIYFLAKVLAYLNAGDMSDFL